MTDLRHLLHGAAPQPAHRVQFVDLLVEATRRRRTRRFATWFGSIVLALGIGGGAAGILAPADHPADVETLPGPSPVEVERGPEVTVRPPTPPAGVVQRSDAAPVARQSARPQDDSSASFAATGVGWEGCVAEGHRDGARLGYNGGLYSSETPSCRYEATRPGGYEGSGVWTLEIRRGTEDIVYRGGESPDCMPVGTIQPGDVVTVATSAGSEAAVTGSPFIRAGPDYGCD